MHNSLFLVENIRIFRTSNHGRFYNENNFTKKVLNFSFNSFVNSWLKSLMGVRENCWLCFPRFEKTNILQNLFPEPLQFAQKQLFKNIEP